MPVAALGGRGAVFPAQVRRSVGVSSGRPPRAPPRRRPAGLRASVTPWPTSDRGSVHLTGAAATAAGHGRAPIGGGGARRAAAAAGLPAADAALLAAAADSAARVDPR